MSLTETVRPKKPTVRLTERPKLCRRGTVVVGVAILCLVAEVWSWRQSEGLGEVVGFFVTEEVVVFRVAEGTARPAGL